MEDAMSPREIEKGIPVYDENRNRAWIEKAKEDVMREERAKNAKRGDLARILGG